MLAWLARDGENEMLWIEPKCERLEDLLPPGIFFESNTADEINVRCPPFTISPTTCFYFPATRTMDRPATCGRSLPEVVNTAGIHAECRSLLCTLVGWRCGESPSPTPALPISPSFYIANIWDYFDMRIFKERCNFPSKLALSRGGSITKFPSVAENLMKAHRLCIERRCQRYKVAWLAMPSSLSIGRGQKNASYHAKVCAVKLDTPFCLGCFPCQVAAPFPSR